MSVITMRYQRPRCQYVNCDKPCEVVLSDTAGSWQRYYCADHGAFTEMALRDAESAGAR